MNPYIKQGLKDIGQAILWIVGILFGVIGIGYLIIYYEDMVGLAFITLLCLAAVALLGMNWHQSIVDRVSDVIPTQEEDYW